MHRLTTLIFILTSCVAFSQSFTDAEVMGKREVCLAAMYGHDSWDTYYEADIKRTNGNIGTLTRQTTLAAAVYGISSKLTLIAMLPYMHVAPSQGTMTSSSGFQDATLGLKYKLPILDKGISLSAFIMSFGSTPTSNYNTELGPMSLGANCNEWANRLMLEVRHHGSGVFFRPWVSYHMRGMCTLERTYYFTDEGYYSDQVNVPDQWQMALTLGSRFLDNNLRIEASLMKIESIGGADIRRYEMPFPGTGMDATTVSGLVQYYPKFLPALGVQVSYMQVIDGRNMGISTAWTTGLMYRFSI
ncbi:MAG TPA: transporter [Saprospiraceae bacterium]|nr:transporter [Saprospiraceae bacterium]